MNQFHRYLNKTLYPYRFTRTRTVRYAFPALALVVSLIGFAALTSSQPTTVRFVSSQSIVAAGERFSMKVMVDATNPVNALDLAIALPEDLVEVVTLDEGSSVITIWTEDPFYEDGVVYLRGGTYRKGFIGTHEIITIELRAKAAGIATVALDEMQLFAGDGSGEEVELSNETVSTKVTIGGSENADLATEPGRLEGEVTIEFVSDIDGDGDVSISDVMSFMSAWHNKDRAYDFNGDGQMTFQDFAIILAHSFLR